MILLDHRPDRLPLSFSGLPKPSYGLRCASSTSLLIRLRVCLSRDRHHKKTSQLYGFLYEKGFYESSRRIANI